jgi:hypothetical protein
VRPIWPIFSLSGRSEKINEPVFTTDLRFFRFLDVYFTYQLRNFLDLRKHYEEAPLLRSIYTKALVKLRKGEVASLCVCAREHRGDQVVVEGSLKA